MESQAKNRCKKVFKLIGIGISVAAGIAVLALLLGFLVQYLWNALMPDIFKLPAITYWQAFGLIILGHILLGGHCGKYHEKKSRNNKKHHFFCCSQTDSKDNDSCFDDSEAQKKQYYQEFWEKEGKQAFERFLESKK